jgi:lauroyl/myristoyl acyltransferase
VADPAAAAAAAAAAHVSLLALEEWSLTEEGRRFSVSMIEALGLLEPDELYRLLDRLRTLEVERFEADRFERMRQEALESMRLAPRLADAESAAAANAWHQVKRNVHFIFLAACAGRPEVLFSRLTIDGLDDLEAARSRGPVIVAGFHTGPNEVGIGTVAVSGCPVTLVASFPPDRPNPGYVPMLGELLPDMDLAVVSAGDPRVLLACRGALRQGRVVMIFPEFAFMGARVGVPTSLADLAHRADAEIVLCHVRAGGDGTYRCTFGPVVKASGRQPGETSQAVFAAAEEFILAANPGEWELWPVFKEMVALADRG